MSVRVRLENELEVLKTHFLTKITWFSIIKSTSMVLRGLVFSSWKAWLTGMYFVRKPWGTPIPTGFLSHPYIFYSFILNLINQCLWIDMQIKLSEKAKNFSLTEQILSNAVFFASFTFDIYFRFNMYRLNIKLANLLVALEEPRLRPLDHKLSAVWTFHRISLRIFTILRYLPTTTFVWSFVTETQSISDSKFLIPRSWHFIAFTLFAAVPHVTTLIFSYDLIVETTFQFLWTFEDFCAHLEENILDHDGRKMGKQVDSTTFIEKFDDINNLASNYDQVIGPIILGVVARSVFSVIHSTTTIVLNTGNTLNLHTGYHVIQLVVELSQFVILKLGTEVHQRISFWKQKLTKACLLSSSNLKPEAYPPQTPSLNDSKNSLNVTDDDTSSDADTRISLTRVSNQLRQLDDLVKCICNWEWKISAGGIFYVDSKLLSGVT
ncbi:unnamed protein product [Orchesella dallaii]|uniref:Gustatory receptor n=1 Tax=Orchesella dallaii TaxID=48710 RepID=A0ABP1PRA0_9HEXA